MNTQTLSSLQQAANRLIDTLLQDKEVSLVVAPDDPTGDLTSLFTAIHEEARRRRLGVLITPGEGNQLCLSLHHH